MRSSLAAIIGTCLFSTVAQADNFDRSITVCNMRGSGWNSRIVHIYATHRDRDDWGDDKLDGHINVGDCRTISPGASQGYCMIDFRAVDANGREATTQLNACRASMWNIRRMN